MAMSTDNVAVTYWEGWHRYSKEPVGQLDKEQARRLDANGKPYTIVLGDPIDPQSFIEVNHNCYGVSFLDEQNREYLMYTFEEVETDRLFLMEIIHREFEGVTDNILRGVVYRFSTDGKVSIERSEAPFRRATITEDQVDVSKNWETKPIFGKYSALIRVER